MFTPDQVQPLATELAEDPAERGYREGGKWRDERTLRTLLTERLPVPNKAKPREVPLAFSAADVIRACGEVELGDRMHAELVQIVQGQNRPGLTAWAQVACAKAPEAEAAVVALLDRTGPDADHPKHKPGPSRLEQIGLGGSVNPALVVMALAQAEVMLAG